jgi:hypothetical protein
MKKSQVIQLTLPLDCRLKKTIHFALPLDLQNKWQAHSQEGILIGRSLIGRSRQPFNLFEDDQWNLFKS